MQRRHRLFGWISLCMALSGCGLDAHSAASSTYDPVKITPSHMVLSPTQNLKQNMRQHSWRGTTFVIPRSWTLQTGLSSAFRRIYQGTSGKVILTSASPPSLTAWLPINFQSLASPYQLKTLITDLGSRTNGSKEIMTKNGDILTLTVTLKTSDKGLAKTILNSWHTRLLATPTDSVMHLIHYPQSVVAKVGHQKWLLAAGSIATDNEMFYLFHSSDNGQHWTLEKMSQWAASPRSFPSFPNQTGNVSMLFTSLKTGYIAELSAVLPELFVYQTHDGGRIWSQQKIPLPPSFWSGHQSPIIHFSTARSGQIFAPLSSSHLEAVYVTRDQGKHWHFAYLAPISLYLSSHQLIAEALQEVAKRTTLPLWGPRQIPLPSSLILSATTAVNTQGTAYHVRLWPTQQSYPINSPEILQDHLAQVPLITWSLNQYPVEQSQAIPQLLVQHNDFWKAPEGQPTKLSLITGLTGHFYSSSVPTIAGESPQGADFPILIWHEGEWTVEIVGYHQALTERVINPLILYLHTHFLPPFPGLIVIQNQGHDNMPTQLDWLDNSILMRLTNRSSGSHNPVVTAQMAVSWHHYS
ncbi:WD40/YVTN/BNR-like repeat-containing protein [Sulfobacillus thermosulfidooxidans]|uniref:WD40/YVTN/BNR-like repeat-containing protein n=1 Tax=Sulfobacillus thermosulfidooxidans TaxID=28034 RepID=UPI0006B4E2FB|nr:hypothetical protein [Sulfobacillus thermosulfidooxidans]